MIATMKGGGVESAPQLRETAADRTTMAEHADEETNLTNGADIDDTTHTNATLRGEQERA